MSEVDPVSGTRLEPFISAGVSTRPERTLLADRAADYLRAGPADARALIASVCQLSALPAAVAEHMAMSLLGEHPRFARTVDGSWRLSEPAAPAWRAQPEDQEPLLSSLSFVVVDVETTGGRPDTGDRITEIAAVTVRDGAIVDVYETLVNPERSIPPFITRLTNISWEMVREKSPFRDVCEHVLRVLEGNVFVAHNAAFDWRFVSAEVARATGREISGRRLCTVRLARRLLPQLRSRSLDWVARHYGVEIEPGMRHRAAGDALATAHCLLRLLDDARGHGCERWSELERFLSTGRAEKKRRGRRPPAMPHPVTRDTTA
ncbi:MAG: polymerase epsilon subunit [Gemmatimonadetes bacterium]|nr:polymerase epsilon subunit [Gemmatimonadota bacterium]